MSLPLRGSRTQSRLKSCCHDYEQEIHHRVTKDTKVRALFFLVTFVPGGDSISLAFGQEQTGGEKSPRNQSGYSYAFALYRVSGKG